MRNARRIFTRSGATPVFKGSITGDLSSSQFGKVLVGGMIASGEPAPGDRLPSAGTPRGCRCAASVAISRIDPALSEPEHNAALKAIDDTMYGLMMVLDGVAGSLGDFERRLRIDAVIRLTAEGEVLAEEIVSEGDEMCMGYHMWIEGRYGDDPVAERRVDA
jgi:hypothetical protein